MLTATMWVLVAASVSGQGPGYVFMSTASGTGNLGSWAAAAGQTGLAAADAVCRSEAGAANLPGAESYIATMSDAQDDLYCRLHALSGKVANACGQSTLPAFAGPWLRRDGQRFATLGTLLDDNAAILPAVLRADGTSALGAVAFNGTQRPLVVDALNGSCASWTSSANVSVLATLAGSGIGYLEHNSIACNQTRPLQCIRPGAHSPQVIARASGREAFQTRAQGNGNLSTWPGAGGAIGIAAGDAVCRAEAAAAGLVAPASFKAWLSDGVSSVQAIERFVNDGPWVRIDGVPIASSKATLIDPATMASPPSTFADGDVPTIVQYTWTGTLNAGIAASAHCSGWTSTSDTAGFGFSGSLLHWTLLSTTLPCNGTSNRLYCFSDLDRLFASSVDPIPY